MCLRSKKVIWSLALINISDLLYVICIQMEFDAKNKKVERKVQKRHTKNEMNNKSIF